MVKVGGSLALEPEKLRALCNKLSVLSQTHELLVVPGGGEFADVVRRLDERFSLPRRTTHRMAMLGMDQYGLLLADLTPNSVVTESLQQSKTALASRKLPILLPSNLMLEEDPLENSWDVTSDSIAVYVAPQLGVHKVVLVTDVDGVYTNDPKKHPEARLIKKLTPKELLAIKSRTSVDRFLPKLLMAVHIECFVVNGLFPERLQAILDGQDTTQTWITASS